MLQHEVAGSEVVDSRGQTVQVAADHVELDLIERSRAGSRPKQDVTPGVGLSLGDAGAAIEKPRQVLQVGDRLGRGGRIRRQQRRQGREFRFLPLVRQGNAVHIGIDLEGLGPVGPVQGMGTEPDTVVGVLGLLVIAQGGSGITVGHGARCPSCAAWRRPVYHSECLYFLAQLTPCQDFMVIGFTNKSQRGSFKVGTR